MNLDSATLLIVSTLLSIVLGVLWFGLSLGRQAMPGLREWGLALSCAGLGSLILALRGLLPVLLSIDLGNALILLACGFCWVGARRFDGRPTRRWMLAAAPLVWLAARRLDMLQPLEARILLTSLLASPPLLACGIEFLRSRAEAWGFRIVLAASFALHAVLLLCRVPLVLSQPVWDQTDALPAGPVIHAILLESILHGVVTSFGLLVLFRARSERLALAIIAAARDEAERANAAKSRFLARMSHELRTPLNGVLGLSEVLAHRPDLPAAAREQVAVIGQAGRHLLAVVNDVLDIGMVEAGKLTLRREIVPLRPLLEDALALLRPEAERRGTALLLAVEEACPQAVEGDARRLRQVLLNLLGNAVKFTPHGGSVTLAAALKEGELNLVVTDTGRGIPPAQRELLFRDFTRLPQGGEEGLIEGHGLGLAITARLVTAMGGRIGVEDGPGGRGSRFRVCLRLPIASLPQATLLSRAALGPRRRILVVDDVAVNRMVVEALLQGTGHVLHQAESGEAALALLEREAIDLLLMDVQMPGLDGLATTRHIRAREAACATCRRVAILGVTGQVNPVERQACLDAGMDGVLAKPVNRAGLIAAIRGLPAQLPEPAPGV